MPQISRRCLARMTGQPYAKESRMLSHFDTIPECERQTDRRTDRQTDRQTDKTAISISCFSIAVLTCDKN